LLPRRNTRQARFHQPTEESMTTIPFIDLKTQYASIKDKVEAGIKRVLEHGQYIMGPEVAECERRLAQIAGSKHCLTVSSGTDALVAPLMALGIGPGDAVFLPTFTFTATAEVVVLVGARPVYVDVHPRLFNIDVNHLAKQVAAVKKEGTHKPRAVIAVDLFGLPADYPALNKLCDAEGLTLIDDAAQSYGGTLNNKRVGSLAPITATSFFPAKPLGCYGDGGAIFLDDDALAAKLVSIRVHGQGRSKYEVERVGLNARFDTIQAAVILAKLDVFESELERRQEIAANYDKALGRAVETPEIPAGYRSAWAQYSILSDKRDALAATLKEQGVPTAIYYPIPMHLQAAYREYGEGEGSCPVSEKLAKRVLSLPMHPYLDDATIERIAGIVRRAA
jgi:UDP-2-acetamido-2-deoxy-ribo-hexuluronate aminotransferase